jgi:phosphatidylethanolamine-binding protein (PEBP) family uncharacterized protein
MYGTVDEAAVEGTEGGNSFGFVSSSKELSRATDKSTSLRRPRGLIVLGVLLGATVAALILVVGGVTGGPQGQLTTSKLVEQASTVFALSSPTFNDQDSLPLQYTCSSEDGVGWSPPFEWTGAPEGTAAYAIILHSAKHWDWGLVNIPGSQSSLAEGCSKPFSLNYTSCGGFAVGSSPDRPMYYYTPPCSEGRGAKSYYFVIYALSEKIAPTSIPNADDDGFLNFYDYAGFTVFDMLTQMENITLATATMSTSFTRWTRDDDTK